MASGEDGWERIEQATCPHPALKSVHGSQAARGQKPRGSKKFTIIYNNKNRAMWPKWQEGPGSHLFSPMGSGRAGLSHTHYLKQKMDDDLLNGYPEEQMWFVRIRSADHPAIQIPTPASKRQTLLWAW